MRPLEPTFPSFTLVLSQPNYNSCLPAYRISHMLRYHPYPRYARPYTRVDPLMLTIDERDEVGENRGRVNLSFPQFPLDNIQDHATATALHHALNGPEKTGSKLRRRLSALVIDLAFYFIQRLRRAKQLSSKIRPNIEIKVVAEGDGENEHQ